MKYSKEIIKHQKQMAQNLAEQEAKKKAEAKEKMRKAFKKLK